VKTGLEGAYTAAAFRFKVNPCIVSTSQLDPAGTREVFSTLRELVQAGDTTVILTGHKLEWLARFADRVLFLHEGRIIRDGPPRDVLTASWIEEKCVQPTRYTVAARRARERGMAQKERELPITLEEAAGFFRWTFRSKA